jgi:hypothetical protein
MEKGFSLCLINNVPLLMRQRAVKHFPYAESTLNYVTLMLSQRRIDIPPKAEPARNGSTPYAESRGMTVRRMLSQRGNKLSRLCSLLVNICQSMSVARRLFIPALQ